jgi:hypothetical protein
MSTYIRMDLSTTSFWTKDEPSGMAYSNYKDGAHFQKCWYQLPFFLDIFYRMRQSIWFRVQRTLQRFIFAVALHGPDLFATSYTEVMPETFDFFGARGSLTTGSYCVGPHVAHIVLRPHRDQHPYWQ